MELYTGISFPQIFLIKYTFDQEADYGKIKGSNRIYTGRRQI